MSNISQLKRKTIAVLDRVFLEYPKIFANAFEIFSLELLSNFLTPKNIVNIHTQKIYDILSKIVSVI